MKPLLIVNPRAAGSRTGKAFVATAAAVNAVLGPVDVQLTARRGHAAELARAAADGGRELVVAVGGDGTLSEVVNGVLGSGRSRTEVGLIAQGTGGDFRRSLGIGRSVSECLAAIASGRRRHVDVGVLTCRQADGTMATRYFLNIVSAGMGGLVDQYIAATPAWVGGRTGYYVAAIRATWRCPEARLRCRLEFGEQHEDVALRARVVAVCNGRFFGSGMQMAPMAEMDDGVFEVISVTQPTRLHMMARSRSIYDGSHLRIAGVRHFRCNRIAVDLEDEALRLQFPLDVDGEALGWLPMTVEVLPAALVVRA